MWDIFFLIAQLIVHNKVFISIQGMFFLIVYDLYGYHYLPKEVCCMYIRKLNSHDGVCGNQNEIVNRSGMPQLHD